MINIYLFCFICALLVLGGYCLLNNKYSYNTLQMMVAVIISNAGYYLLAISKSVDEAIVAAKVTYVAGCFLPLLILLCMCEICQVKINRYIVGAMYILQTILLCIVGTIGHSGIYYKTVNLEIVNGVSVLHKEYGPFHTLHLVSLLVYFIASLIVALISLKRKQRVSTKNVILIFVVYLIGVSGYLLEKVLHVSYEIVPIVNTLLLLMLIIPMNRITNMYFIRDNINRVYEEKSDVCFISFNTKLAYTGCNPKAREVFNEINSYFIDSPIPKSESVLCTEVLDIVTKFKETGSYDECMVEASEKTWKLTVHPIKKRNNQITGYLAELLDVTKQQKYIDMVENYNLNLQREIEEKTKSLQEIRDRMTLGFDYSETAYSIIKVLTDESGKPVDWIFTYFNDAMARLLGIRKEELLNKPFLETYPDGDRKWLNYFYPAAFEGKTFVFEDSPQAIGAYMRIQCFPLDNGYCGCIMEDANSPRAILRSKAELEMINDALCSDYIITYVVNLENGMTHLYEKSGLFRVTKNQTFKRGTYDELAKVLTEGAYVEEKDRPAFDEVRTFEKLQEVMETNPHYVLNYSAMLNGEMVPMRTHFAKTFDGINRYCVIAIKNESAKAIRE